jgi:hypothetical protein
MSNQVRAGEQELRVAVRESGWRSGRWRGSGSPKGGVAVHAVRDSRRRCGQFTRFGRQKGGVAVDACCGRPRRVTQTPNPLGRGGFGVSSMIMVLAAPHPRFARGSGASCTFSRARSRPEPRLRRIHGCDRGLVHLLTRDVPPANLRDAPNSRVAAGICPTPRVIDADASWTPMRTGPAWCRRFDPASGY